MSQKKKENNPYYRKPEHPSHRRRAMHHDYTRPARYMITLYKASHTPILSEVRGNLAIGDNSLPEAPHAYPTPVGQLFYDACNLWKEQYPQIRMDRCVIMPDHIHFCIAVTSDLPQGLSRAIASLMGKTTVAMKNYMGVEDQVPFFDKGYSDSIAYNDEQYRNQIAYVEDNPRRLLMKRSWPDFYRRRWIITVGQQQMMAVGNILLLKNPMIQVVRYSHHYSDDQMSYNRQLWNQCLENGGALISPFIHPIENDMRKRAMREEGNVIRICENGFADRFAPAKTEFEYMATGHLLLIGPMTYNSEKVELRKSYAMKLNDIASLLASHPQGMTIRPV